MKFGLNHSLCHSVVKSRGGIPGQNTSISAYAHTSIHILDHHTIIWSALGLEGSAPRGYSCFTAGPVTLPPPSPRPSPRERATSNQHTPRAHCPPTAPCPPAGTRLNTRYFKPTHLLKVLVDTHLARKLTSLWLSNWNLLTGNERKCADSSFIQPPAKQYELYIVTSRTGYRTSVLSNSSLNLWSVLVQLLDNV